MRLFDCWFILMIPGSRGYWRARAESTIHPARAHSSGSRTVPARSTSTIRLRAREPARRYEHRNPPAAPRMDCGASGRIVHPVGRLPSRWRFVSIRSGTRIIPARSEPNRSVPGAFVRESREPMALRPVTSTIRPTGHFGEGRLSCRQTAAPHENIARNHHHPGRDKPNVRSSCYRRRNLSRRRRSRV